MLVKVNIMCPSCRRRYSVEVPNAAGVYSVSCPGCSAPYSVTIRQTVKQKKAPVSGPAAVALKAKRCEVVSGVAWLLIGVVQLLMVYTAAAGVWNVINAIVALRNSKNITPGNPHVIPYFEGRKVWLIVMAVVNLILGGVVGALLVLFDWHVRDFVLRNRSAFEG